MPARDERARAELSEHLGLAPEDASLYLHLVLVGPTKAGDVAESLHLHRSEAYRALDRLVARGLARLAQERPALYAATELSRLLDEELRVRLAAIDALRETRHEIESLLAAARPGYEAPRSTYRVLRGRTEIYRARRMMLQGARERIDWATTFEPALAVWEESGERAVLRDLVAGGVRLRALLPESRELDGIVRAFDDAPHAEVRVFRAPATVRFLVVDGRELLIFVVNDPSVDLASAEEVAIHTTAPAFVHAQEAFFEQSWRAVVAPRGQAAVAAREPAAMRAFAEVEHDAPRP